MNVFSLTSDSDHYQSLILANEEVDLEVLYRFNGTPIGAAWQPLQVELFQDETLREPLPATDYSSLFAGLPVFSQRAVKTLLPILRKGGELLPLKCEAGEYLIYNVTRVVDALDEASSEIVRFPDGKKVMDIKHFVFVGSRLRNVDIFKLPQLPLASVFVTDRFVQAVRKAGLTGFAFEWLWSSEQHSASFLQSSIKVQ